MLVVVVALAVAAVGGYLWWRQAGDAARGPAVARDVTTAGARGQTVYFRHNGLDAHFGKLARVHIVDGAQPEFFVGFDCEVVHVAGDRGLCLSADRGVITTYEARIFDTATQAILHRFPLEGLPSRCRVAADGKRAALTVFVTGHGYDSVDFSTQTLLIDLETGQVESDLDTYTVTRDGRPFKEVDFNYWGVTFDRDSRWFYATLSSGGQHYLVRGDAERRTAEVVRAGVECPSLSPDGRRVAFKQRSTAPGPVHWSIAVLDLENDRVVPIAERNSVDDQIEWLDDGHVLYSMPVDPTGNSASTDVWMANADGGGEPRRLLGSAYSPAVLRD